MSYTPTHRADGVRPTLALDYAPTHRSMVTHTFNRAPLNR